MASAPQAVNFIFVDELWRDTTWSPQRDCERIFAIADTLASTFPADAAVGLLFKSGIDLVRNWFACINAGLRPLILQYPNRKQSRAYWFDSVTDSISRAGLQAIIADAHCAGADLPRAVTVLCGDDLPSQPLAADARSRYSAVVPATFRILQLSSGTTGYRKAMQFDSAALHRHARDYNLALGLSPGRDRIVSWLPLYHDMGYVACFVMPILLGVDVVMIDPVDWVQAPQMLFDAIARHHGTICYMPNFAFEVLARVPARALPSMRRWISCSEPVSAVTAEKFLHHIGAPSRSFNPCYAMAENLFAVTLGSGITTRTIEGVDYISCGHPVPGVMLKVVDGQIWVRSPTSLHHYLDGVDIRDEDGFYPSGDMGEIADGELYVTGRKQDVLIQAGRKFMLSDMDAKLNELYADIRGRAVTLALRDDRLGTETPLILIEAVDFFERSDAAEIAAKMMDATGIDQLDVAYVPPRFLTKTSSGKLNRKKCLADWIAVRQARGRTAGPPDALQELRSAFPNTDWSRPMKTVLDSLSMTLVQIILQHTDALFDPMRTLDEVTADLHHAAPPSQIDEVGIRIVSLADLAVLSRVTDRHLRQLSADIGCKVTLEHICLPPSAVLLSDLVFHDYFQPRLDQAAFSAVDDALDRLKSASVILVDNVAEMSFLGNSTYPVLSHTLQRDAQADLLSVRWQSYTRQHHQLPVTIASGRDIPLRMSNTTLDQMSRYLQIPIFRIASLPDFGRFCDNWEFSSVLEQPKGQEAARLVRTLTAWIKERPNIRRSHLRRGAALAMSDMMHFCAKAVKREVVETVIAHYDSFYIAGQPCSLPYLRQRLDELGKAYTVIPSFAPEILDAVPEQRECLIACGAMGELPPRLPTVIFQCTGAGPSVRNADALYDAMKPYKKHDKLHDIPPSGTDWYHNFELEWETDIEDWRLAKRATRERKREMRARLHGTGGVEN